MDWSVMLQSRLEVSDLLATLRSSSGDARTALYLLPLAWAARDDLPDPLRGPLDHIRQKSFYEETVRLDGRHFGDCTFHNCVVEYSGGSVVMERNYLHDCRYIFFEQAQMTVPLRQGLGLMSLNPAEWVDLPDQVH